MSINNVNYAKPLMVMKRDRYCKKPYHKNRFLYVERALFASKRKFMGFLRQSTSHWDDGEYTLRIPIDMANTYDQGYASFANFDLKEGKIALKKNSDTANYMCWDFFNN